MLVIGSGNLTHNLGDYRLARMNGGDGLDYVRRFPECMTDRLQHHDLEALLDYRRQAPDAARAHPSDEHLQPLYVALGAAGFELKMFTLREVDLGETGEVIQSIVRAETELERENAFAKVRKARLENDAAVSSLLDGIDGDVLLRYRQIESWRDILHRWDGDQPIPSALTVPLTVGPMPTASSDTHVIDAEESADPAAEQQ
jgi:hypothetical protein